MKPGISEVRLVLRRFFGDSREKLMLSLLGDSDVTPEELQRLRDAIQQARACAAWSNPMEANLLQQLISTGPAELLIASIWQGLLLTAVAWAALKLAPGLRASTRFTVWMIVFTLVALLPCFAAGRAFFAAPGLSQPPLYSQVGFGLRYQYCVGVCDRGPLGARFPLRPWSASALAFCRCAACCATPARSEIGQEMQSIVTRRGARPGSRPVEVRLSDAVDAPSVIGFFHPAVVVPRSLWSELTPSELQQIILHEMAHLDRGDDWTNLLQKLLRALCPLNPALFWAERQLCLEREQACDDAVLDAAGNRPRLCYMPDETCRKQAGKARCYAGAGLWKRPFGTGRQGGEHPASSPATWRPCFLVAW